MNPSDVNGLMERAEEGRRTQTSTFPGGDLVSAAGDAVAAGVEGLSAVADGVGAAAEVGGLLLEAVGAVLGGLLSG